MVVSRSLIGVRSPLALSAALFFVLWLCGCGSPSESAGSAALDDRETSLVSARALVGSEWVAESLEGLSVLDEVQPTIRFDAEGGVSGNAGCNDFSGAYVIVRERIRFGTLSGRTRKCPGAIGEQEKRLLEALAAARLVRLVDGSLVLRATEEGVYSRFVPGPRR